MAYDHSTTYRTLTLRNIPHRMRLRAIERAARRLAPKPCHAYADFGCSNGYITDLIARSIAADETTGFDHTEANLAIGRTRYPQLHFETVELNAPGQTTPAFDFVTCFETLEHVGDLRNALSNIVASVRPSGSALITVPIESGVVGTFKYLIKRGIYRYSLKELSSDPDIHRRYFRALVTGKRISTFRSPRKSWGTHFGFDYRDVDAYLRELAVPFRARSALFTRFYEITLPG
ncbi:MAG TPA: class I SAM-dependent methyltransferase [Rhizomicrobium sp.]|jgi:SAM-dependent methyltransferase|nr:class I SAM-dependent methyltransferase [Rhizomicrobium sp.]